VQQRNIKSGEMLKIVKNAFDEYPWAFSELE
jgi:hypothetical protein